MRRLALTPGEPAGVGPDLTIELAQHDWPVELVVCADPDLLMQRARQLGPNPLRNGQGSEQPMEGEE